MILLLRSNCWNNLNLLKKKINPLEKYRPFPPQNKSQLSTRKKSHFENISNNFKNFNHHKKDSTLLLWNLKKSQSLFLTPLPRRKFKFLEKKLEPLFP